MPLISLVLPVRNAQKYLPGIFRMLEKQTGAFELEVVSNDSTDGTVDMFRALQAESDFSARLTVLAEKGVARARNRGIDASQGEYVAFIDADDRVTQDYIATLSRWAEEGGFDVMFFRHAYGEGGIRDAKKGAVDMSSRRAAVRLLRSTAEHGVFDVLVSSAFLRRNGIRFDESAECFEDYAFLYALLAASPRVRVSSRTVYLCSTESRPRFSPDRIRGKRMPESLMRYAEKALPGRGGQAASALYLRVLVCAARTLPMNEFRAFAGESGAKERLKGLTAYCGKYAAVQAALYRISPTIFAAAARMTAPRRKKGV